MIRCLIKDYCTANRKICGDFSRKRNACRYFGEPACTNCSDMSLLKSLLRRLLALVLCSGPKHKRCSPVKRVEYWSTRRSTLLSRWYVERRVSRIGVHSRYFGSDRLVCIFWARCCHSWCVERFGLYGIMCCDHRACGNPDPYHW